MTTTPDEPTHLEQETMADDNAPPLLQEAAEPAAKPEDETAKLRDQWLRAVAETENIRKRSVRDVEETRKYAINGFARDIVNVVENLQRALDSMPQEPSQDASLNTLREGVSMTLSELLSTLERHGVKRIFPIGEKFDHNLHQAVAQVDAPGSDPGSVVHVMQAGYTLHDRLLRPAMVSVAKAEVSAKIVDTQA